MGDSIVYKPEKETAKNMPKAQQEIIQTVL